MVWYVYSTVCLKKKHLTADACIHKVFVLEFWFKNMVYKYTCTCMLYTVGCHNYMYYVCEA